MTLARRAEIVVAWMGTDITRDLEPYLLGLSYTDNLSGEADGLSLELDDRDGLWSGDWRPAFGDTVIARILATPWISDVENLRLGLFSHDRLTFRGPPRRLSIDAISAAMTTGLRRRKRTRSWNGVTLYQIASDIATRAGLTLDWTGSTGRAFRHRKQNNESDLEFLQSLCRDTGRALKITESKIVIFSEYDRDLATPIGTIDLGGGYVLSWSFEAGDYERYGSCRVTCTDPRTGKAIKGTFTDPDNSDGPTLEKVQYVESIAEAEELAEALLRAENRFATTGHLQVMGDPGLVAGVTFDLIGASAFNGRYIVTRAEHSPTGGYTCSLDIRRTLESY